MLGAHVMFPLSDTAVGTFFWAQEKNAYSGLVSLHVISELDAEVYTRSQLFFLGKRVNLNLDPWAWAAFMT